MRPEVWAPNARSVQIDLDGSRVQLEPDARRHGWWHAASELPPGTDYRFVVDGGPPLADPRSRRQPDGVHEPSRVIDTEFPWTDDAWRGYHHPSSVIYEIHVGTFTEEGTFDAAIRHLDHLVALGITAVEVMPVASFPGHHGWGYDGVGLWSVHEPYGGPDGLKRFVDACHHHGLGVILDVVYNHLGPDGNVLGAYGPYFTDRHQTPWGDAVNLDGPDSDEVRSFVVGNAVNWITEFHVDGLRLDAVHELHDTSDTHLLAELQLAAERAAALHGRPVHLIAESDSDDGRLVRSRDAGGFGLAAAWADELHHALHTALTGESSGYYSAFDGLKDLDAGLRASRRAGPHDPGWRFVTALQNHDQIGNRARGDRLHHLVGLDHTLAAASIALCSPTVPLLFQGEDWASGRPFPYFTDHQDPDLARAVSEGRRREFADFGWRPEEVLDPQDPATFEMAVLDWTVLDQGAHARTFAWYQDLIAMRRSHPDLSDGDRDSMELDADPDTGSVRMRRGSVTVLANLGRGPISAAAEGAVHLRSDDSAVDVVGDGTVRLAPGSAAVVIR